MAALRVDHEPGVREVLREALAEAERRHGVLATPEEDGGLLDRPVAALHVDVALPTHRGERGGDGPGTLERGFHLFDELLGDELRIVEGLRDLVVRALLVPEREHGLADAALTGPVEERRELLLVDPRVVEGEAVDAFGRSERRGQRHRRAPRVRHERRVLDPALVEQAEDEVRLRLRRVVPLGTVGPAEALEVERDDTEAPLLEGRHHRRRPRVERQHAEPVNQDDDGRRLGAAVDEAHARAADVRERRVLRLVGHRPGVERQTPREDGHEEDREEDELRHGVRRWTSESLVNSAFGSSACDTMVATCVAHWAKKPNVRMIVTVAPTVRVSTVAMRSTGNEP